MSLRISLLLLFSFTPFLITEAEQLVWYHEVTEAYGRGDVKTAREKFVQLLERQNDIIGNSSTSKIDHGAAIERTGYLLREFIFREEKVSNPLPNFLTAAVNSACSKIERKLMKAAFENERQSEKVKLLVHQQCKRVQVMVTKDGGTSGGT